MRIAVLSLCFILPASALAVEPSIDDIAARLAVEEKAAKDAAGKVTATRAELKRRVEELLARYPDLFAPVPVPPAPPPVPVDPLKAKLRAAFDGDGADLATKKDNAKDLAALYRAASKLCASPEVATAGQLLSRVKTAATTMLDSPDALKGVRVVVGAELGALFPADGPLSDEQRVKAAELFGRLAVILDSLGA